MNKKILTAVLACGLLGGCVTNVELSKGNATDKDTLIIGRLIRTETGKKANWWDVEIGSSRICRGELRAGDDRMIFLIHRNEDNGFFFVKVPPAEGRTFTSLGVYCGYQDNVGGFAGAASAQQHFEKVIDYSAVNSGPGVYILPSTTLNFGIRAQVKPLNVKVNEDGKYEDTLKEFHRKFPGYKNLQNIVRVPAAK